MKDSRLRYFPTSLCHLRRLHLSPRVSAVKDVPLSMPSLTAYPPEKIRNFGIVAHVDHGKSTLADRLLKLTNVIGSDAAAQYLDKLQVERERGITVKAQTCTMFHNGYMLNLVDTPGHVDFSYEVARSLAACDGILLLVAANQGIQAQTIANFWLAFERDKEIIPVINKIDMASLRPGAIERVEEQLGRLFDFEPKDILRVSAKTGENVPAIFNAIVERVPAPTPSTSHHPQALIFDSWFTRYKGAVSFVRLLSAGSMAKGERVKSSQTGKEYEVAEVGIMHPEMRPVEALLPGQVGYIACNMRSSREAVVGDILYSSSMPQSEIDSSLSRLAAISPPSKSTVYACLYPMQLCDYEQLENALEQLCLNDSAVEVKSENSDVMGHGWRLGFLGLLHMEVGISKALTRRYKNQNRSQRSFRVFCQRLEQEFHDVHFLLTAPTVEYKAEIVPNESIRKRRYDGKAEILLSSPSQYPKTPTDVAQFYEPLVAVTVLAPKTSRDEVVRLCEKARGVELEPESEVDDERLALKWSLPLAEVVVHFFDDLKRITSGYVSFDYEPDGYRPIDLVKISVFVNNSIIDELSTLCQRADSTRRAKILVEQLKEEIPRQQYEVNIKAVVGESSKAIANAIIRPFKKSFMSKLKGNLGGGGMQRLQKLLKYQDEGKARLKAVGNLRIPKEVFINVMRKF